MVERTEVREERQAYFILIANQQLNGSCTYHFPLVYVFKTISEPQAEMHLTLLSGIDVRAQQLIFELKKKKHHYFRHQAY